MNNDRLNILDYKEYFDIIKDPLDPSSSQLHVMVVGGVRASAKEFIPMVSLLDGFLKGNLAITK